uniref:caspase-3b n=1 Tax=Doryrhamphus excisus TaxID=161450 RepID=UPI0025AE9577|nr:caspase-3b [Doryrhamphus excisus]XP_057919791.1 caspase-3b [Doryrhamphus excisus]XP_057919792.1 caspase-3b [Doryrhamphus excisus]
MADLTGEPCEDTLDAFKLFPKRKDPSNADSKKAEETDSVPTSKASACNPYCYRMDYPHMGLCLIINNKNFHRSTNMSTRNGTDVDAAIAMKTFSELGYSIKVATDQTVKQMTNLILSASQEDHSSSASFVCVLLSHGDEGVIFGTDGFEQLENLTRPFKGHRCKTLVGKPKLFFIQACRGSALDDGTNYEADSNEEQTSERIPVEADFLYAYSTAPGYYSWRNTQSGSWFMQALCDMLQRHKGELELMQIMTRVNHKVAMHFESSSNLPGFSGKKQIPCIVSMLTKDLYFPK